MKIALIIEHFDATRGGAEAFTVWLAYQLVDAGHDVHIICHDVSARIGKYREATQRASHDAERSRAAQRQEATHPDGLTIHTLRGFKLSSGIGFRMFGRRVRALARRLSPDIVHSLSVAYAGEVYHSQAGVYASLQAQAVASRSTSASANWKRLMLAFSAKQQTLLLLEKRAIRPVNDGGPRRLISLSPMMTHELETLYAVSRSRICELPNPRLGPSTLPTPEEDATDRAWFRDHYRLGPSDRVAVFVGHDFRRKGLRYAIETIAKTQSWKLLVVGLGKAREYVELANSLGMGDIAGGSRRILFVGPTKEMNKVYAASDALLLPTFYDSFALVVPEALSHGIPVISTEFLGAGYLVKEHHVGTLVKTPRDIDQMAQALESLPAAGTPAHAQLAAAARAASTRMSPENFLEQLLALYQEVLREKIAITKT